MKTGKEIKEPCLFLSDCGNYIAIRRNHTRVKNDEMMKLIGDRVGSDEDLVRQLIY